MDAKTRHRGVIKGSRVRLDEPGPGPRASAASPLRAPAEAGHAGAPRVRLLQLDEGTQAIEHVCSCGEVSLIEIRSERKP